MRAIFLISLIFVLLASQAAAADTPREEMSAGHAAFQAGRFDDAAAAFGRAAEAAPTSKLDPSHALYNQASALSRRGQLDESSRLFADALKSTDLRLQASAYFNRGNVLAQQAQESGQTGKTDNALKQITEALSMYENSMLLQPADEDPKINYELALQLKDQLEQQKQQEQEQQKQEQQKDDKNQQEQDKKEQQQQQDEKKDQQDKQDQQAGEQPQPQPEQQGQQQTEQPEPKSEEMTPKEAQILLDAMRQEEQRDREQLRLTTGQPIPVDKDW